MPCLSLFSEGDLDGPELSLANASAEAAAPRFGGRVKQEPFVSCAAKAPINITLFGRGSFNFI